MTITLLINHGETSETISGVRMFTVYPGKRGRAKPEIVVHFVDPKPQMNIPLKGIQSITTILE